MAWGCGNGRPEAVVLATTTSVEDSGLLTHLLNAYREEERNAVAVVRPLAVGSGEALELGRRGDADVLIVHYPSAELAFIAEGYGEGRVPIMTNDFVVLGPPEDPAGIGTARTAPEAFRAIAATGAQFLSRGDRSGTHGRELELWDSAGVVPNDAWYVEAGQGMGPLLQIASERGAYALSDRATFLTMRPRLRLDALFTGDPQLKNIYSAILVRHSDRKPEAQAFWTWLISANGQRAVASYRDSSGRQLFDPVRQDMASPQASSGLEEDEAVSRPTGRGIRVRGSDGTGLRSSAASTAADGRPSLLDRFLCRSVPPALADSSCG